MRTATADRRQCCQSPGGVPQRCRDGKCCRDGNRRTLIIRVAQIAEADYYRNASYGAEVVGARSSYPGFTISNLLRLYGLVGTE